MWSFTLFCLVMTTQVMSHEIQMDNRIIEGQEATPKQFPYQVALTDTDDNDLFCGGSIIKETKILTAAHCMGDVFISNPSAMTVYAGSIYRTNGTIIPIAKVARFPNFDIDNPDNDVAMLTTRSPIIYTDYIKPINLPPKGRALTGIVTISGWGRTVDGYPALPLGLRYVNLTVIDYSTCKSRYGPRFTENMWCAGNLYTGGPGACQGDSGGPAVQDGLLVGITSWGGICGGPGYPPVFSNVASNSIQKFITENGGL